MAVNSINGFNAKPPETPPLLSFGEIGLAEKDGDEGPASSPTPDEGPKTREEELALWEMKLFAIFLDYF